MGRRRKNPFIAMGIKARKRREKRKREEEKRKRKVKQKHDKEFRKFITEQRKKTKIGYN